MIKKCSSCCARGIKSGFKTVAFLVYILNDFENASPRLNPLFHKLFRISAG